MELWAFMGSLLTLSGSLFLCFFSPLIAFVVSFFLWLLSRDMNMGAMASARVLHMRGRTFSRQTTEEFHELIRE